MRESVRELVDIRHGFCYTLRVFLQLRQMQVSVSVPERKQVSVLAHALAKVCARVRSCGPGVPRRRPRAARRRGASGAKGGYVTWRPWSPRKMQNHGGRSRRSRRKVTANTAEGHGGHGGRSRRTRREVMAVLVHRIVSLGLCGRGAPGRVMRRAAEKRRRRRRRRRRSLLLLLCVCVCVCARARARRCAPDCRCSRRTPPWRTAPTEDPPAGSSAPPPPPPPPPPNRTDWAFGAQMRRPAGCRCRSAERRGAAGVGGRSVSSFSGFGPNYASVFGPCFRLVLAPLVWFSTDWFVFVF